MRSVGLFLGRPDRSARLARGLRARGWSVTRYDAAPAGDDDGVLVRPGFHHALARALSSDHDVYYTGLTHVPSTSLLLNRMLRRRPYVFHATGIHWQSFRDRSKHRLFAGTFERRVHPFLLTRTYGGASRIVCNSRFLEKKIAERHPEVAPRLRTIYNGIDFDRFAAGERRRLPGARERDRIVVCVTTLNYANKSTGIGLVLEAFERLRDEMPDVRLVVAAKTANEAYRAFARERVAGLRHAGDVSLHFNVPSVADLLSSADVFVYASPDEGDSLPRAVLEAQAAGLAVAATATNGCPEAVADGETGILTPYEPGALANALRLLLEDGATRQAMGRRAGERVRALFDWERMVDGFAEELTAVLDGSPASASSSRPLTADSPGRRT